VRCSAHEQANGPTLDESNTDLVVIASIVAALHFGVAALAGALFVRGRRVDGDPPAAVTAKQAGSARSRVSARN